MILTNIFDCPFCEQKFTVYSTDIPEVLKYNCVTESHKVSFCLDNGCLNVLVLVIPNRRLIMWDVTAKILMIADGDIYDFGVGYVTESAMHLPYFDPDFNNLAASIKKVTSYLVFV